MTVTLLASGIDSLYWSVALGIAEERFAWFKAARDGAAERMEVVELGGYSLTVEPHGAGRYPVLLRCAEFSVQLTDSAHIPTAFVQLRAEFIHQVGPRQAFELSREIVEALCQRRGAPARVSRLDVYADFGGWTLTDGDRRGLVTAAKLFPVLRAGSDEYETIRVGTSPMVLRLYRKDIELRVRGGFADSFWNGYEGPVVRVEAQASSQKLRTLGIASVDDALASYGAVWTYATGEFCVLRTVGPGARGSWPLTDVWLSVWGVGALMFPQSDLVPLVKAERDEQRVARGLLGFLASWSAFEGVFEAGAALERLRERYPRLVIGERKSFAAEVVRRHARLSRAVRERNIG